jgi:hypothetical protein
MAAALPIKTIEIIQPRETIVDMDRTRALLEVSLRCAEAAAHMAGATEALSLERADAEKALAHLDAAIDCLKRA